MAPSVDYQTAGFSSSGHGPMVRGLSPVWGSVLSMEPA